MNSVIPVILCGGSGTRLWPLSRRDRPKQLTALVGEETLLEATMRRARGIVGAGEIICVTADEYGADVRHALDRVGLRGRLLLEPEPRNTAPAFAVAALAAARLDPSAVLVALPADHFIEAGDAFSTSVAQAWAAAVGGWLTILGVGPRYPSPAFGYIMPGAAIEGLPGVARVRHFIEKPPRGVAEDLIVQGALWNAGIVVARADLVIAAIQTHEPSVLAAVERSLKAGERGADGVRLERRSFVDAPNISFDKAVLERHENVAVTALDAAWRDVGTWGEVAELYPADEEGNRHRGRAHFSSSHNSFVFSPHRLTVGIGLTDMVVIDTPDALLIAKRDDLGRLREVVESLAAAHYPEVSAGLQAGFQVNEISLVPGEVLRREPHQHVTRYCIVLEGSVEVTIGGVSSTYGANQSFHVPPGNAHYISSSGAVPAKLIEVQVTSKGPR